MSEENGLFNPLVVPVFIRGGDGKTYQRVTHEDGSLEHVEVAIPHDAPIHENADGTFVIMRDAAEAQRQRIGDSHKQFFEGLPDDPKAAKRQMKRQDALQRQFEQLAVDRVMPPSGPQVEIVKDEVYLDMMKSWLAAKARGQEKDCDFQPLPTYQRKLQLKNGRELRPLYQGEVGMKGHTVVCLEPGYGTRSSVSVLLDIGKPETPTEK